MNHALAELGGYTDSRPSDRASASLDHLAGIPRASWDTVRDTLDKLWIPRESPHHSIIGLTGSGKSFFVTRGLLPLVEWDNVLIIDNKGDDPTLRGVGKPVKELPSKFTRDLIKRKKDVKPRELWYRLLVHEDFKTAAEQVKTALATVWDEGKWFVVIDECRALTDSSVPGLGLRPQIEQMWLRGRSREICVIAMTQSPRWVPNSFYTQPSYVWIGRLNDEDSQKRLREIGGLDKAQLAAVKSIKKREFLLVAEGGDYMAITGLGRG